MFRVAGWLEPIPTVNGQKDLSHQLTQNAYLWTAGHSQRTRREPTQKRGNIQTLQKKAQAQLSIEARDHLAVR